MSTFLDRPMGDLAVSFRELRGYMQRRFGISRDVAQAALSCAQDGITRSRLGSPSKVYVIRVINGQVVKKGVHQLWLVNGNLCVDRRGQIINPYGWEAQQLYVWLIDRVLSRQIVRRKRRY